MKIKKEILEGFIALSLVMIIGISWGNRFKHNLYIDYKENKKAEQNSENQKKPKEKPKEIIIQETKLRDKGKDVEYIQDRLVKYGYDIEIDGQFGYATYEALLNFQYKTNLELSGEANKETIDKLKTPPTNETMYKTKTPIDFTYIHSDINRFVSENDIISYTDYLLITSRQNRMTYIFKKSNDSYKLLESLQCTVGASSTPTITGEFRVGIKGLSFGQEDGFQAKYYTQISGNYLYHSVIYNQAGTRVTDGRLGGAYSHGCIRLDTEKAKWIYDNIPQHTTVIIK